MGGGVAAAKEQAQSFLLNSWEGQRRQQQSQRLLNFKESVHFAVREHGDCIVIRVDSV